MRDFVKRRIVNETPLNKFLWLHGQRSNIAPMAFAFFAFYYLGSIGHYCNYKRNVVEDKWVKDYG